MREELKIMAKGWVLQFVMGYGLWLIMAGWSPSNAGVGVPAAALAAWAGVILLPPTVRLNPFRLVRFAAVFISQSVVAGVDVAWRVFVPNMSLHPGIVRVTPRLQAGSGRLVFRGLASLQPGSLACGVDEEGYLLFHCLDTREDVEGALSRAQDEFEKLWKEDHA